MLDSQTFLETMRLPGKPKKKLGEDQLWELALRSLGGRAYAAAELRRKLALRAETPAALDRTMKKLQDYGLLNDIRFAESYATARLEGQGLGARRVLADLRAKRVSPGIAENAVRQTYAETDELDLIEKYLQRKFRGKNVREYLSEDKHLASAFRRLRTAGFSAGGSIRVLKRYTGRAEELESMDEPEGEDETIR
ncbi:MAG TPA: regulatory protein RecX [Bryobacteraceae bacterium]|nr:regulatory protein RecX [Bryobacteraceae bacterium]